MTEARHISQEDLTLYAMQALTPEESDSVRAHLQTCANCREDLSVLHGDLALLALSVEQHSAPEGVLTRVLDQIHADRLHARPAATGAAQTVVPGAQPERSAKVVDIASKRRVWPVLIPWVLAAMLAVACSLLGYKVAGLNESLGDEARLVSNLAAKASYAQQVLEVLNASHAQRVTLTAAKTPPAPTAHTIYLADRGALLLQASNLQPIPAGKTYELWVIPANGKAPVPAGTFRPDARGYASVVLPSIPSGIPAKAFGITVENAGGAQAPTLPILLSGE
ncbi:MAG: anti-sigma factor [Acidobacteriaceae bacterium]